VTTSALGCYYARGKQMTGREGVKNKEIGGEKKRISRWGGYLAEEKSVEES